MKIRFLTIAEIEVDEAVSWYQKQTEDQDLNFSDELARAIRVITTYPRIATEIEPDKLCTKSLFHSHAVLRTVRKRGLPPLFQSAGASLPS